MSSFNVGEVLSTSYGTGPYRIVEVREGCCCPSFLHSITDEGEFKDSSPEHYHLICRSLQPEKDGKYPFNLNGYLPTMKNVWNDDFIIKHAIEPSILMLL